jgi:hypothetical protein
LTGARFHAIVQYGETAKAATAPYQKTRKPLVPVAAAVGDGIVLATGTAAPVKVGKGTTMTVTNELREVTIDWGLDSVEPVKRLPIIESLINDLREIILKTGDQQANAAEGETLACILEEKTMSLLWDLRDKTEEEILDDPESDIKLRVQIIGARARQNLQLHHDVRRLISQLPAAEAA